uniref:G-protein coupled receptors family 1 profile domain-containing protein n=1 Tax=Ditylenchus dipsaci TaxID=166011 RepID=A0A915DKG9_9BILA
MTARIDFFVHKFFVTYYKIFIHLLTLFLGLFFNLLLAWLILSKKNDETRQLSRIFLQTCLIDLIFLAAVSVTIPKGHVDKGSSLIIQTGPLSHSSKLVDFACLCTYYFAFELLRYNLPVQFFYRYLVLCRQAQFK